MQAKRKGKDNGKTDADFERDDTMNELMQQGSEAGATPPTEA
ncbi:hypothetical protein C5167_021600 [Papaver somniferum]|nr:hypothetical protein C5167_021600 [Papaver somniferum]